VHFTSGKQTKRGMYEPTDDTRSQAMAEKPRDAQCQLKSDQLLYITEAIPLKKACNRPT